MVRRYIRDGSLFRENSAGKLGPVVRIPGDGDQRSELMSITIPK